MHIEGPAWDLSTEYTSLDDPALAADLTAIDTLLGAMEPLNDVLGAALPTLGETAADDAVIHAAQAAWEHADDAGRLLANLRVYASCLLSVDSQDAAAQALQGQLDGLRKRRDELGQPQRLFTLRASDADVARFLAGPRTEACRFQVLHARQRRDELLSLEEEQLAANLAANGLHAWGKLYTQLSGTLTATVDLGNERQEMGLARAAGLMQSADPATRRAAWQATNAAWGGAAESCAATLNAIGGWRQDMNARRAKSAGRPVDVLDEPLHLNRVSRATLDTLLGVARDNAPLARRVAALQGRAHGQDGFGPWDNRAPAPLAAQRSAADAAYSFDAAIRLIREACGAVDGELADFVQMMVDNRWIEGTVGDRKRTGAYCTRFAKSRTPRVYMTYTGGASDVITLAHELGHAYHNWVIRDLPDSQKDYGMSLAETASTFCETVVRDALIEGAADPRAEFDILWEDVGSLVAFVLNIPTRFQFEQRFNARRAERPLQVPELNALMAEAWQDWYGEVLVEPDPLFWASKLHFHISEFGFYNFPYLFGYLFSLGVYAKRGALGDGFFPAYRALLLDTGRMTAEDVAARHLDADLTRPAFWQASIDAVAPRVDRFETLVAELT